MKNATGRYIGFVDSDDYIGKEMYSSMLKKIEQYQCDVAMCDCIKEFRTHTELYTHDIRGGYYSRKQLEEEYYPHLSDVENQISHHSQNTLLFSYGVSDNRSICQEQIYV